jgi:sulfate permease, SulP family
LRAWLSDALGSTQYADRLAGYCHRLDVPAGDILARQGDPAGSMHFILEGRVGVMADLGEGRTLRLRSLGRHTTIGEMGLITGGPRSATIRAEADSALYELRAEDYERIKRDDPALSQALLGYVVSVMSDRLRFANRAIGILQR